MPFRSTTLRASRRDRRQTFGRDPDPAHTTADLSLVTLTPATARSLCSLEPREGGPEGLLNLADLLRLEGGLEVGTMRQDQLCARHVEGLADREAGRLLALLQEGEPSAALMVQGLKHSSKPVRAAAVMAASNLGGSLDLQRIRYRILITNGYFTSDAKRRAFKLGITLVDRESLRTWWQTKSAELGRAVKPRKYQAAILEELVERFDGGEKRFFVELATGLGKTYLAAFFTRELLRREELKGARVLCVAHQVELLEQASASFRNILGVGGYSYSACFDGSELRNTDLVFASFATLHQTLSKIDPRAFDIVVVDEAHHSAARTYSRVIEHLRPRALLGLSATPFRADDKDVLGFFGGESAVAGRRDVLWAIRHGYLARPRYKVFLDDIDPARLQLIRTGLSLRDLDRTLFLEKRDDESVRLTYEHITQAGIQDVRGIVFCRSIRHMRTLIEAFPPGSATLVHSSGMAADTRAANIRAFREGRYQFILVRDLFNEGVDIPETNVLVFLRSTRSRTIWLQQLGRGLRKTDTKKEVQVLDFVGSVDRLNEVRAFDRALRVGFPPKSRHRCYAARVSFSS